MMQRVFDFLKENPIQYLATVGLDGKPKVRPFQMMYHDNEKPVYCTGAKKDVFAELVANPYLEICVSTPSQWLRIRGRATWIEEVSAKHKVLECSELVKSIYKSVDNPLLKVFFVDDAEASISDFSGAPPLVINLSRR